MIGADPKLPTHDLAGLSSSGAIFRSIRGRAGGCRVGSSRWRRLAVASVVAPLSLILAQRGKAPSAGALAANAQVSPGGTVEDRFPTPSFRDRFPTATEGFEQRQTHGFSSG